MRGVSQLLGVVVLIIIVFAVSVVIYVNFSTQLVARGKQLDIEVGVLKLKKLNAICLLKIQIYNVGNVVVESIAIKLGDTLLYENNSVNLNPGCSLSLNLKVPGCNVGSEYIVFIEFSSPDGSSKTKQYEIIAEYA